MTSPLDAANLRARIQTCVDQEIAHQRTVLAEVGPDVDDVVAAVETLLAGGKRLRAAFLYWGYRGAGRPDSPAAIRLATAMEFFQAAVLLHDDVMDDSDTRRGMPAAHRALAQQHAQRGWEGSPERFGLAGAVLAGNLCLTWADELYSTCGLASEDVARGRALFDRMRTQLMAGQFLDVVESVRPWDELSTEQRIGRAAHVIRYKSAKYTIEHPLLIGATIGGIDEEDLGHLSTYGLELGHAFQLRDDVLGVFGDPAQTGKPAGDDVREGKRTVLMAHAMHLAGTSDRALVVDALGRVDLTGSDVDAVRAIIVESGALAAIEADIDRHALGAREALARGRTVDPEAAAALASLIDVATARLA